ncbi:hypothetical protein ES705_16520 [subsurface metagenome]
MWLRLNGQLVLDYYDQFGESLTLRQFNLKPSTMDSLFKREGIVQEDTRYDRAEALAKIAIEGANEARRGVRELKSQYSQFTELVAQQLLTNFFVPLLKSVMKLPPFLEAKPDRDLLLSDLA